MKAALAIVIAAVLGLAGCAEGTSCLGCGPYGPRETPPPRQQGPPLGGDTCQQLEDAINAPGIPEPELNRRYRDCL